MSEGRRKALQHICQQGFTLQFVLYGGMVALLIDVVALLTLDPASGSYTVALINLPGLVLFMLLAAAALRVCTSYR